ncbi:MAG TPA: HD domain-containing phosphohydrolase [Nevskiaceae bacterium]|nr:HD domain-containing phosphohydrolase [Nevskiaceae bacterium]
MTDPAKAEPRTTEAMLRAMVGCASDIIAMIDARGVILHINQAVQAIGGYAPAELVGTRLLDLVHPDDLPEVIASISRLQDEHALVIRAQRRYRHKLGHWITLESSARHANHGCGVDGIVVTMRDISERKRAELALARVTRAYRTLSAGSSALVEAGTELALLQSMCAAIVDPGGYRMAWVGMARHDAGRTVQPIAWSGEVENYLRQIRISWADDEHGRGPTGRAVREGTPQVAEDIAHDPSMLPWRKLALQLGFASSLALPLCHGGETYGALMIYAPEPDAFAGDEVALLGDLAQKLAYGIAALRTRAQHESALQRLERSMVAAVQAIAATLEQRDPFTAGHQRRTADLSSAIGAAMGMSSERLRGLELAAAVHDVGKIMIPAEILSKPGRLSDLEMQMVRLHPLAGHDILKDIDFPWPIAEIVYQHHERMDGSGYPRGLKGDAILLEARIIAVADTVVAMSTHRPYSSAQGLDSALVELASCSGKTLDAAVVDVCLSLFHNRRFHLHHDELPARR